MVRRKNNFALVETPDGKIEGGKWIEAEPSNFIIEGRVQFLSSSYQYKSEGDEVTIKAKFFTNQAPVEGAGFLVCNGVKYRIVDWMSKQTHNLILLTK
jgi:hypothetical protein